MAAMEIDENDGQTAVASAAIVDGLLQDVLAEVGLVHACWVQLCLGSFLCLPHSSSVRKRGHFDRRIVISSRFDHLRRA
jgi:hypothetical protein